MITPKENPNPSSNLTKTLRPSFAQTLKNKEEPTKEIKNQEQLENNYLSTQSQWRMT